MGITIERARAHPCLSILLSHLLAVLFAAPWASPEPAHGGPVPQASGQSGHATNAGPPKSELTPPPKSLLITPNAIGIVAGEPQLLHLLDDRGRRVREAVWTVSDPTRAEIKVDGDAAITGLAPGKLTVTAAWRGLTAQARVTVLHSLAQAPVAASGSVSVEGAYFSEKDSVADRIIAAVNHTNNSLDLAIFDLTHAAITAAIEDAQRRGVLIRIVADQRQAKGKYSKIPYLIGRGIPVQLRGGHKGGRSLMHDKFGVFDGRLVVTGSFNWTTSADTSNAENAVFISDPTTVIHFAEAFDRLWSHAP